MGKQLTPAMAPIIVGRLVRVLPSGRRDGHPFTQKALAVCPNKGIQMRLPNGQPHWYAWHECTDDRGHNSEPLEKALERIPPAPPTPKAPMTNALSNAGTMTPRPIVVQPPDIQEAQRLRAAQAINGLRDTLDATAGQTAGDLGIQIVRQAENVEAAKQMLAQAEVEAKRIVADAQAMLAKEVAILRSLRADAQDLVSRADKLLAGMK